MKKAIKIMLLILSLAIVFSFVTTNFAYAEDFNPDEWDPWKIDPSGYDKTTVENYTKKFAGYLSGVGITASVIAFIVIGIKLIIGSATDKAEYKKTLVPVVIGILVIVFISTILGIFASVGDSINS